MSSDFSTVFQDKKVFITGHTGFKGSWLTQWLLQLGASVTGYALSPSYENSLFQLLDLGSKINNIEADIRDIDVLKSALIDFRPDFIFHLAAQAIVSTSYKHPLDTISTNVLGTANILEGLRHLHHPCCTVLITSDKAYFNSEWVWGYRETDRLGGKDIYSGSKGAAELVIESYFSSFFSADKCIHKIATARAGNVIGGGDWAEDRLIPDIYRNWSNHTPVLIRSPSSTRPWQHVLEPLSGYLSLASSLYSSSKLHGQAFNFGPSFSENKTVIDVINSLFDRHSSLTSFSPYEIIDTVPFSESSLLKLNCDKALSCLSWQAKLSYDETIKYVSEWYESYLYDVASVSKITINQISEYMTYFSND